MDRVQVSNPSIARGCSRPMGEDTSLKKIKTIKNSNRDVVKIDRPLKRSGRHENRQGGVYKKVSRDSNYIGLGTIHRKDQEDDEVENAT